MDDFRKLKPTDVMIIGGGLAGLRAGIEASKRGASVRIVSKEKCEGATSSVLSHGYITRCPEEAKDKLFEEMLWAGGGLNDQYLLRAFIDDVTSRVEELKEWGVELVVVDENPPELPGLYRVVPQRGKLAGYPLVKRLREICIDRGVEFVEEVAICSLLKGEEGIIGALGVDLKNSEFLSLPAKAVVLATGGGSALFQRHNNTKGTTGDGFVLGLEAGASLINIEFIIFDVPYAIFNRILQGDFEEWFLERGNAHYFLGGVRIDEWGRTAVNGLFAGGEVTGNLFGAGRLGGTAMADVLVFGARAGSASAEWARERDFSENDEIVGSEIRKLESKLEGKISPREVKAKVKRIMWEYCGIYKTEEGMKKGLEELRRLKDEGISREGSWRDILEAMNMLELSEIILKVSLVRQESRGSFWRPDYPLTNNKQFFKNLCVKRERGEYELSFKDVRTLYPYTPIDVPVAPGCFSYRF